MFIGNEFETRLTKVNARLNSILSLLLFQNKSNMHKYNNVNVCFVCLIVNRITQKISDRFKKIKFGEPADYGPENS